MGSHSKKEEELLSWETFALSQPCLKAIGGSGEKEMHAVYGIGCKSVRAVGWSKNWPNWTSGARCTFKPAQQDHQRLRETPPPIAENRLGECFHRPLLENCLSLVAPLTVSWMGSLWVNGSLNWDLRQSRSKSARGKVWGEMSAGCRREPICGERDRDRFPPPAQRSPSWGSAGGNSGATASRQTGPWRKAAEQEPERSRCVFALP